MNGFIEQQMIDAQNNITKVYNVIDKALATISFRFQLEPDAIVYNKDRDAYVVPIAKDKSVFCAITHNAQTVTIEILDVDLSAQTEIPIGLLTINIDDWKVLCTLRLSEIDTSSGKANTITSMFCEVAQVIKERNDPKPVEEEGPDEVEIVEDPGKAEVDTTA
jgi:hypothetical protein